MNELSETVNTKLAMKLDRNITNPKRGKYALIKLRETTLRDIDKALALASSTKLVVDPAAVDFGDTDDTEFFVIRLKDKYAEAALHAYAKSAEKDDPEYATDVLELSISAALHPNKRRPD